MSIFEAAALIAAVSFALLAIAGVLVLARLGRVLAKTSAVLTDFSKSGDDLLDRASAAVARANAQLDRTDAVADSMDELGAGVSELAGQVTALAGAGRAITAGPVGKLAAVAYGVRHAVRLRRPPRRTVAGQLAREGERAAGELAGGGKELARGRQGR